MVAIAHPAARSSARPLRTRPLPTAATYRRRRLVAAGLALLLLVAIANLALELGARPGSADDARPVVEVSVLVEPGDTVWSIARSLAGDGDVRPVVDALVEANGSPALAAGERLVLVLP
jgi:hypothetical protein